MHCAIRRAAAALCSLSERWQAADGVCWCGGQVAEVRAVVAMMPAMPHYPSTSRHSIRSRAWGASLQGCSFKVQKTNRKHTLHRW